MSCPNCGGHGPHFVPPSCGESGFFICEKQQETKLIKPRNTLVVLRLIEKAEYKVGSITVPAQAESYCEAEVIAVGPGNVSAEGGRSETFDLKVGQRVWVKHKKKLTNGNMTRYEEEGLPYRDGDTLYHCFEQNSIIGVIADSVTEESKVLPPDVCVSETKTGRSSGIILH